MISSHSDTLLSFIVYRFIGSMHCILLSTCPLASNSKVMQGRTLFNA